MDKMDEYNFKSFVNQVRKRLDPKNRIGPETKALDNFPLTRRQCIYVIDWGNSTCSYSKGVESFLGYKPEEFNFELISKFYHPHDLDRLHRIIQAGVDYCIQNDVSENDFSILLAYRVRHKKGHYVKVLRQTSMFQLSDEGRMISNFSLLTDISFIDQTDRVFWTVHASHLNEIAYRRFVYKAYEGFFTERESDILRLMQQRFTNSEIADKLVISKHTVATHRKNIYRKSRCSSLQELMDFAHNCGALG